MIKVFLDNGEIIECPKNSFNLHGVHSTLICTTKKGWFSLKKNDGTEIILNPDKILRIEIMRNDPNCEVEFGPYSEDIIVD